MSEKHQSDQARRLLGRLVEVFQIPLAEPAETSSLKDIPHDEACNAFTYWLDQIKLVFGEPASVFITQGLQDEGVDMLVHFLTSDIKFGFQLKSFRDIKANDFRPKTMSQITYSKKHRLENLFLALCGDMTDSGQREKVHGLISNLSQIGEYVIPIQPEKAVTVIRCHEKRENPINYIKGAKEIGKLLAGLAESLSSDAYSATVAVRYKLKEELNSSTYPIHISMKFKPRKLDELSITPWELIRRAQLTGETVTIPGEEIEEFTALDRGKPIPPIKDKPKYVRIIPEKPVLPSVRIETASPGASAPVGFDNVVFVREKVNGSVVYLSSSDQNLPYHFHLTLEINEKSAKFNFRIDPEIADAEQHLLFQQFIGALTSSGLLMVRHEKTGKQMSFNVKNLTSDPPCKEWVQLLENLAYIQKKIGRRIFIPDEIAPENLPTIKEVVELLKRGKVEIPRHQSTFNLSAKGARKIIEELKRNGAISDVVFRCENLHVTILGGQDLPLGPVRVELARAELLGDINSIEKELNKLGEQESMIIGLKSAADFPAIMILETRGD